MRERVARDAPSTQASKSHSATKIAAGNHSPPRTLTGERYRPVLPNPPLGAVAGLEIVDDIELGSHNGNDDELGEPLHRLQRVGRLPAIPAAHHQLPLLVRVDQADEIACTTGKLRSRLY